MAFLLGWFASWLLHRLSRVTRADMGELERMAQSLHEAEETRDEALSFFEEREQELDPIQPSQSEAEMARRDGDIARPARRE